MDLAGLNWFVIDVVAVALLAIVLVWALIRNRRAKAQDMDRTEAATSRLYKEEDAARDPMDDGTV
jgi:hypothetical protein